MNILKQTNSKKSKSRSKSLNVSDLDRWRLSTKRVSLSLRDISDDDFNDENFADEMVSDEQSIDWEEYFSLQKDNVSETSEQDHEVVLTKKQTLILATMVPNELLLMDDYDNSKRFVGVLLMADVSGFTALSERYNSTGQGGAYRLTVTLNTYLGSLIELIYSHGGDVLKFAGDAFLALWKHDKKSYICHTIHTVIACALIIQHSYSSYETDVKVNLKVKLAISAGNLYFAPIGRDVDKNYVITGLPVFEAKDAESVCASGEVKISPSAWGHCYSRNYDHIIHEDGHATIRAILYDPREPNINKPFTGLVGLMRLFKRKFSAIENLPNDLWDEQITADVVNSLKVNELVSIRETILESVQKNNGAIIRKFMIRPVVQQIDAHQPLEYLTEMRQVTIMFITLKPRNCNVTQLITIVSKAYEITSEIVYKSMGCVNKIILFDKDVMILVVFGLRGFKHESEAQAALKSAYSIRKFLSILDGVLQISIGLTTGIVYCGVVGHPLRREFTVIGAIVNKAARLMCNFRDKITCDELTFIKSKLSANSFILQPTISLKGIENSGKIYEYNENIRIKEIDSIPILVPLLNRNDEMEYFNKWISNFNTSSKHNDAILIVGENRIGKTRLLEYMARQARNQGFNVCSLNLTSIHTATPYLAVTQIVNQLLQITEPTLGFDKEERIVRLMQVYNDDLCYLNKILRTRFAYHEGVYSLDEYNRTIKKREIFKQLLDAIADTFIIFIDDLHNLDPASWEFISMITTEQKNIFTVFTITKDKINTSETWQFDVFVRCNFKKIVLGPLKPMYIAPLACQILDVKAVPIELCSALQSKCKCIPGLIETFVVNLFSSAALDVQVIGDNDYDDIVMDEYQFPDVNLLNPIALNESDQPTLVELITNENNDFKICVIIDKKELYASTTVENVDALVIMQIDSLTPYQQLLLKIASVIGSIVSRDLLENIMYENSHIVTAKAVKRLFAIKLLSCANNRVRWGQRKTLSDASTTSFQYTICCCNIDYDEIENDLPKHAFCNLMKFRNKKTRKTCYELLPLNQKKEFHTRIVNYLENSDAKCVDCGGIVLVVQSFSGSIRSTGSQTPVKSDSLNNVLRLKTDINSSSVPSTNISFSNDVEKSSLSSNDIPIRKTKSESIQYDDNEKEDDMLPNQSFFRRPSILKSRFDADFLQERRMNKRVTMPSVILKALSSIQVEEDQIFSKIRRITEAEDPEHWDEMGIKYSYHDIKNNVTRKKSYSIDLEKGASKTNFKKCSCVQSYILLYEQLIHHALQAELKIKAIEFIIQYCKLNIRQNKTKNVFEKLSEAENMCNEDVTSKDKMSKNDKNRLLGRIYTLLAEANNQIGNYVIGKLNMELALNIYKVNLHRFSASFLFNNNRMKLRGKEAIIAKDCISCLNVATILFQNLGEDRIARISAYKVLKVLQKTDCSVTQLCEAYSNAIVIELDRGYLDATEPLENAAQSSLKNLIKPVKATELFEIGKLFLVSFHSRLARGLLLPAIRSGYRSFVISRFVCADNVSMEIIPDLFYVLLARKQITEAIDLLSELLTINKGKNLIEYEVWYYALCMDMVLDAGFQLEYPGNIIRFAELVAKPDGVNGNGWKRLVVNVWTYCLRCNMNRKSKIWEEEAMKWANLKDVDSSLSSLLSALRLAEGMLESLSRKVTDLRKVVDLMELRSLAERELNNLERDIRLCRLLLPRWYMLKSCCYKLSGRTNAAVSCNTQALDEAKRLRNYLEIARASQSNSAYWADRSRAGCYMDWQDAIPHVEASWQNLAYRFTVYKARNP